MNYAWIQLRMEELMIYYTNVQLQISLQKCYMCIHKYLTLRHDYSFGIAEGGRTSTLKDDYDKVCAIGQVAST